MHFADAEIMERETEVVGDVWVGFLLLGQGDVQTDGDSAHVGGTSIARFHDARPAAGDHHELMTVILVLVEDGDFFGEITSDIIIFAVGKQTLGLTNCQLFGGILRHGLQCRTGRLQLLQRQVNRTQTCAAENHHCRNNALLLHLHFWLQELQFQANAAADIGIVGKDILMENEPDIYELLDLGIGKCRMCVAGPVGFEYDQEKTLRVATKYVNVAKKHFMEENRDIEIIKLNGSIELGPILGLTDVIVDIVETGTTIKENDLEIVEAFKDISARLIANKASFKFKNKEITQMTEKLREIVRGDNA